MHSYLFPAKISYLFPAKIGRWWFYKKYGWVNPLQLGKES